MIKVEEWITESRDIRTNHLCLDESCIERGGNSTVHRGVLAQYLDTNMPPKIDLCHACHNEKCSNPKHLYWGTRSENIQDAKDNGTWKSVWDRQVEKLGYAKACELNGRGKIGNTSGAANKGKPKSEEQKRKISESVKAKHEAGNYFKNKPGRKKKVRVTE